MIRIGLMKAVWHWRASCNMRTWLVCRSSSWPTNKTCPMPCHRHSSSTAWDWTSTMVVTSGTCRPRAWSRGKDLMRWWKPWEDFWSRERKGNVHFCDVIMGVIASQSTSLTIVYSTVYPEADQRKHQSSVSLAFVRGIHRWPVDSRHKRPVTQEMFPFNDVIMESSGPVVYSSCRSPAMGPDDT